MVGFAVNPGDMRTQITLQSPTIATDAGGAQSVTYANAASKPTVWARWTNAHGVEVVQSESLATVQRATVAIRYRSDVLPTWRVLKDSEPWQILSVDHVQDKRRFLELIVERVKGTV